MLGSEPGERPRVDEPAPPDRTETTRPEAIEPYAAQLPIEFTDTGVSHIDVDEALETCDILIVLVDHDVFRVVPLAERAEKLVYDTRGIWPDQPRVVREEAAKLALAD